MRWCIFIALLLVFAAPAFANEQDDQLNKKNVYDAFRELKISTEIPLEEGVTARIKRYMANLLYPVDMTSFLPPEKDSKFRELILVLQKQMGEAATGVLTYSQFDKLQDAARNIDELGIYVAPGKFVSRLNNGDAVGAKGTGVMNDLANPININRMLCVRSEGTCEMDGAELDLKGRMLISEPPEIYDIKTWTGSRVTAIKEHPCGTSSLTVDVDTQDVTITSVPHADLPFCSKEGVAVWKLADGFKVVWDIYRDRYHKARMLVYEPARKFFPERVPAK